MELEIFGVFDIVQLQTINKQLTDYEKLIFSEITIN
jgi:hypothetical protein